LRILFYLIKVANPPFPPIFGIFTLSRFLENSSPPPFFFLGLPTSRGFFSRKLILFGNSSSEFLIGRDVTEISPHGISPSPVVREAQHFLEWVFLESVPQGRFLQLSRCFHAKAFPFFYLPSLRSFPGRISSKRTPRELVFRLFFSFLASGPQIRCFSTLISVI